MLSLQPQGIFTLATLHITEEFEKLSYAEKIAELKQLEKNAQESRGAEIANLVAKFKGECAALDLPILEVIELLTPKQTAAKASSKAKTASGTTDKPTPGVIYKSTTGDETWSTGKQGPRPKWLRGLLESGAKWADLEAT